MMLCESGNKAWIRPEHVLFALAMGCDKPITLQIFQVSQLMGGYCVYTVFQVMPYPYALVTHRL